MRTSISCDPCEPCIGFHESATLRVGICGSSSVPCKVSFNLDWKCCWNLPEHGLSDSSSTSKSPSLAEAAAAAANAAMDDRWTVRIRQRRGDGRFAAALGASAENQGPSTRSMLRET
uniref:Uncharacterized protein n=1 Tax=Physcomitrium patens TaxID=3218 RepID=A9S4D2_PHYPA|nr:hypothetical protein PHYPA_004836 [Physcomitrium patens]